MDSADIFPDAEAIAIKHLRTVQTLALTRVYGARPKGGTYPLITLHRSGGLPAEDRVLDNATIQVDVWGAGDEPQHKAEARYIAAQARAILKRMQGEKVSVTMEGIEVGGHVTSVKDVMGLTHLPDSDDGTHRYMFMVGIKARALPQPG